MGANAFLLQSLRVTVPYKGSGLLVRQKGGAIADDFWLDERQLSARCTQIQSRVKCQRGLLIDSTPARGMHWRDKATGQTRRMGTGHRRVTVMMKLTV